MAKRRNKTRSSQKRKQSRVNTLNANRRLRSAAFKRKLRDDNNRFIEDRRRYNPEPIRRPKTIKAATAPIVSAPLPAIQSNNKRPTLQRIQQRFALPKETLVCVRRKMRKEVLHALNKAGKGGQRRQKRTEHSNTKC